MTSTRIRYPSPPPRENDAVLQFLTKDRGFGRFQPRHTPSDVCAAQDVALGAAGNRNLTIRPPPSRADSVAPAAEKKKKKKKMHRISAASAAEDDDYAVKAPPPPPSSSSPPPPPAPPASLMHPSPPSSRSLAARAASPKRRFSSISASAAPSEEHPDQAAAAPAPRRERKGKGRIGTVRASELVNLAVNAEGLDPSRQEPRVRMEYLSKGKWYEVTGGRPLWAEDERERVVSAGLPSVGRRTRASPGKYAQ